MYYSHFGLKQPPFKITPNIEFFFSGGNRGAVLDALVYAITSGEGIIKVVGEAGSGKTMLCRMLETLLPENVERVYLANPSLAPEDILHAIAFELQLEQQPESDRLQVMHALQNYLIDRHAQGRQVVVFVEEAQGMPLATLEEIRLLSNLETKNDKLLQIVLFGQPELDANLNEPHIRQLKERITHSFNLGPLNGHDIEDYIIYRMRTAGYFGPPPFSKRAIKQITKASKGLVRRINILADKALLAAFAENVYAITHKHVDIAIRDSEFGTEELSSPIRKHFWWLAGGMLVVGLGAGFILHTLLDRGMGSGYPASKLSENSPPQKNALMGMAPPPTASDSTSQPASVIVQPSAEPSSTQMPANLNAGGATLPLQGSQSQSPAPADTAGNASPSTGTMPSPNTISTNSVSTTDGREIARSLPSSGQPDILEQRLEATRLWLAQQPSETVTIQIMSTNQPEQILSQLRSLSATLDLDKLYVYRTTVKGTPLMSVLYGSFPNWNLAEKTLAAFPQTLRNNRPRLRTIGGINRETNTFQ